VGYSWKMLYSSDKHGFSSMTLYRLIDRYQGTALLLVKDMHGEVRVKVIADTVVTPITVPFSAAKLTCRACDI
jgi:hypothetical protein